MKKEFFSYLKWFSIWVSAYICGMVVMHVDYSFFIEVLIIIPFISIFRILLNLWFKEK